MAAPAPTPADTTTPPPAEATAPAAPAEEPVSPRTAYRALEKERRAAERDAQRDAKRAERDKARAEKEADRERLRAEKDKERDAAREKRRHEAELRRAGKPVPHDDDAKDEVKVDSHKCADDGEEHSSADTGDDTEHAHEQDDEQPEPAAASKPAADAVPVRLAAIKALELPAGAQACIALPIEGMRDIRNKKHSWNVIQKQYGKYNENNTLEDTPEDSCNPSAAKKGQRPLGGMGFQAAPLDVFPATDVELKYSLQFGDTFNPQLGGKLPGLMMAQAGNRKGAASGGRHSDENASVRLMWRANLMAEAYVYATAAAESPEYQNLESCHYNPAYGDSIWRGLLNFKPKVWNQIVLRAKLNTPGTADGLLSLTVNGVTKQCDKMMWRKSESMVITSLFFSTFYGGSKPDWACPTDTCIRFKDFVLTKYA